MPGDHDTDPSQWTSARAGRRTWTVDDVRGLGMTTDLETAAEIIGIGRTLAYELARDERVPRQAAPPRTARRRPHPRPAPIPGNQSR